MPTDTSLKPAQFKQSLFTNVVITIFALEPSIILKRTINLINDVDKLLKPPIFHDRIAIYITCVARGPRCQGFEVGVVACYAR